MRTLVLLAVLAAAAPAQKPWDTEYPSDVPAPEGFRANRTSYSAVMDVLGPERPRVTQEQLDALAKLQMEAIWGALPQNYRSQFVPGFHSTRPGERIVGRALTIRSLPKRPDLERALETLADEGDWDRRFYIRAGEEAEPGDVVVVDLGGVDGEVFFGDITALGIKLRGAEGVIIDGGTRDLAELQGEEFAGFPVFARFFHAKGAQWSNVEFNAPIRVGNATVLPGDVVVAEDEGLLFFPPELVPDVLATAKKKNKQEDYQRELMKQKKYRVRDVYPLHPKLQEEYEEKTKP